jgi:hypothetical protein
MSKLTLVVVGAAILVGGMLVGIAGRGSFEVNATPINPQLVRAGSWMMIVGAAWLIVAVGAWLAIPKAWDAIAPFLVGAYLTIAVLGNLILSQALALLGLPSIIRPEEGRGWRVALTVGSVAIAAAQASVSVALARREDTVAGSVWRLRASAIFVVAMGLVAAWTSPVPLVAALTLAAMIYIAVELLPR